MGSLYFFWLFDGQNSRKSTKEANLLAVATIFIGLWTLIFIFTFGEGGACTQDKTKLPMQELEQGGLCTRGGAYLRDSTVYVQCFSCPVHLRKGKSVK